MAYTKEETRARLIDLQIKSSNWLESHIVREYYFIDGRSFYFINNCRVEV